MIGRLILLLSLQTWPCSTFRVRVRSRASTLNASTKLGSTSKIAPWPADPSTWPVIDFGNCPSAKLGMAPVCLEMLFSHQGAAASEGSFGSVGIVRLQQMDDSSFLTLLAKRKAEVVKVLGMENDNESDENDFLAKYQTWFAEFRAALPNTLVGEQVFMKVSTSLPCDNYREIYWGMLTHIDENLRQSPHIAEFLAFGTIARRMVTFFKNEAITILNSDGKVQSDAIGLMRSVAGREQLASVFSLPSPSTLNGTQEAQQQWADAVVDEIQKQTGECLEEFERSCLHHSDIKGNNIIVAKDGYVKFIDFGLSWDSCVEKHGLEPSLKEILPKHFKQSPSKVISAAWYERDEDKDLVNLKNTLERFRWILSCRFKTSVIEVEPGKTFKGLEESDLLEVLAQTKGQEFALANLEILKAQGDI